MWSLKKIIGVYVALVILIPVGYFLLILLTWDGPCYGTTYELTLIDNPEDFNQPYVNRTDFDFDSFPTLKEAMSELIDWNALVPTGKTASSFSNCRNEVDDYLYHGDFLEAETETQVEYFAYYSLIFQLIPVGGA